MVTLDAAAYSRVEAETRAAAEGGSVVVDEAAAEAVFARRHDLRHVMVAGEREMARPVREEIEYPARDAAEAEAVEAQAAAHAAEVAEVVIAGISKRCQSWLMT